MADYRQVHKDFYKKARKWTPIERDLFKFLCEHEAPKVCGLHVIDIDSVCFYLGYEEEEIADALRSLEGKRKQLVWDRNQIFIFDYAEHQGVSTAGFFHEHVLQTASRDVREGNKASQAFLDKYKELLTTSPQPKKRKKRSAESESESPKTERSLTTPLEDLPKTYIGLNSNSDSNTSPDNKSLLGGVGDETPSQDSIMRDVQDINDRYGGMNSYEARQIRGLLGKHTLRSVSEAVSQIGNASKKVTVERLERILRGERDVLKDQVKANEIHPKHNSGLARAQHTVTADRVAEIARERQARQAQRDRAHGVAGRDSPAH